MAALQQVTEKTGLGTTFGTRLTAAQVAKVVWKTAHGTRVHWSSTFTGTMIDNNESVISAFTKCSAEIHQRQTSVESSWTSRFGLSFCRNLQSLKLACVFSQVNHASKIWWHSVCENAARERNKPREALLESWVLPGFAWD
jgi:hypothetical protein